MALAARRGETEPALSRLSESSAASRRLLLLLSITSCFPVAIGLGRFNSRRKTFITPDRQCLDLEYRPEVLGIKTALWNSMEDPSLRSPLLRLPRDVWSLIYRQLAPRDLLALSATSKTIEISWKECFVSACFGRSAGFFSHLSSSQPSSAASRPRL